MLSLEVLCAQEGQVDKDFGKLITSLYPDGIPGIIAHIFNAVAELLTEEAAVLGLAPAGTVESDLGSNPSHIGVRFRGWFRSLKAFSTCLSLLVILSSFHEASVMAKVD